MSTTPTTMNMDQAQAAIMALLKSSGLMQAPGGEALPRSGSVVVGGNEGANRGGSGGGRAGDGAGRDGSAANGRTVVGGGNSRTVTAASPVRPPVQQASGVTSVGKGGKVLHQGGESLQEELDRLRAENERLRETRGKAARLSLKVSEKGALSVYGLGRFPQTLYKEQWLRLLAVADDIREFIADNDHLLKAKGE